jgi:PleD family two-component response regulator
VESDLSSLGRRVRVLVADDDEQNRKLLEEVCQIEGFDVQGVGDGEQALSLASNTVFDLALLDAAMPAIDGIEVCRRLKSMPATAALPVIIVTASLEDTVRDRAVEVGANAFITKPFRIFDLSQRMRAALRLRKSRSDPPTDPHVVLRRSRADALTALPSPSNMRGDLQRQVEICAAAGVLVACAVIRIENETAITANAGRTATDAILGHIAIEIGSSLGQEPGGFVVRSDVDELLVGLREEQLPTMASLVAHVATETTKETGMSVCLRWGALLASPRKVTDTDELLSGARAAADRARQSGENGAIERAHGVASPLAKRSTVPDDE